MNKYIQVLVSIDSFENAKKLARIILEKKLAACIQIINNIDSQYWWKGNIEESKEALLLIKTKSELYPKLELIIKKNHPYEIPEILCLDIIKGNKDYFKWMDDSC